MVEPRDQSNVLNRAGSTLRPYLDSSVFIAHIKKEETPANSGVMRWGITQRIFGDAVAGRYQIYTSTVTFAEVRRIKRKDEQLDPSELDQINDFFENSFIVPVEVDREVGERAQKFGSQFGIDVVDSIHFASTVRAECDILFVWDKRFVNSLPDVVDGVRISEPFWEGTGPLAPPR